MWKGDAKVWKSCISRLEITDCCSRHSETILQSFIELDVCSSDDKTFDCSRVVPTGRERRPRFGPTDREVPLVLILPLGDRRKGGISFV
jgi:hypothetical protein